MQEHKNFWDKNAGRYDRFMRKDRAAYDEMYELIRPVVKAKTVLELATGTGLIAKHIVNAAAPVSYTHLCSDLVVVVLACLQGFRIRVACVRCCEMCIRDSS